VRPIISLAFVWHGGRHYAIIANVIWIQIGRRNSAGEHDLAVNRSGDDGRGGTTLDGGRGTLDDQSSLWAIRWRRFTSKDRPERVDWSTGKGMLKEALQGAIGDLVVWVLRQFHGIGNAQMWQHLEEAN
jgi:hypothetical protein